MADQQSFAHHTKWVRGFHFFVIPALVVNLVSSILALVRSEFAIRGFMGVLTAVALLGMAFYARLFALTVQDRVIRLEERLRLEKLLPEDLKGRIGEFTRGQLVAMRFASDGELPVLARKVLTDKVESRKSIKQMVENWRADHLRA